MENNSTNSAKEEHEAPLQGINAPIHSNVRQCGAANQHSRPILVAQNLHAATLSKDAFHI
jgi:hypothetical protein